MVNISAATDAVVTHGRQMSLPLVLRLASVRVCRLEIGESPTRHVVVSISHMDQHTARHEHLEAIACICVVADAALQLSRDR